MWSRIDRNGRKTGVLVSGEKTRMYETQKERVALGARKKSLEE